MQGLIRERFAIDCFIEIVPPHTLPRTSSGKLSRSKAREEFLSRHGPAILQRKWVKLKRVRRGSARKIKSMRGVIALTGATGFIGSAIARKLVKEGWRVRALIRAPLRRERLEGIPIQWVHGTLEDIEHLDSLVGDADAVVHCAGAVRGITDADFYPVNVEAVSRLAHIAAIRSPAPRFLLISSLAAREPNLSVYAASKRMGEIALSQMAGGFVWTVLRPPAVYGPGDRAMLPLFRLMGAGSPRCWAEMTPDSLCSMSKTWRRRYSNGWSARAEEPRVRVG